MVKKNIWIGVICAVGVATLGFGWDMLGYTNPELGPWVIGLGFLMIFIAGCFVWNRLFPSRFGGDWLETVDELIQEAVQLNNRAGEYR